jgi:hypothetical protein
MSDDVNINTQIGVYIVVLRIQTMSGNVNINTQIGVKWSSTVSMRRKQIALRESIFQKVTVAANIF